MGTLQDARSGSPFAELQLKGALLARERLLPLREPLSSFVPLGGLPRGATTLIDQAAAGRRLPGGTTLALELLAGASQAGHWCAAVALPDLGLAAARERGFDLERLLLVPHPGGPPRWQQVVAALFDGVDALLFAPPGPVRPGEARKLSARAKERGAAFVVLDLHGRWGGTAELKMRVASSSWAGLGSGHGKLSRQSLEVEVSGRGAAARPRLGALEVELARTA